VRLKLCVVVREDVSGGEKIKVFLAKLLLHPVDIFAELVLPGDFVHPREYIDLLALMKTFEGVVFTVLRGPQHIPLSHALGVPEAVGIEDLMNQLVVFI
jgi:hypothetical protein